MLIFTDRAHPWRGKAHTVRAFESRTRLWFDRREKPPFGRELKSPSCIRQVSLTKTRNKQITTNHRLPSRKGKVVYIDHVVRRRIIEFFWNSLIDQPLGCVLLLHVSLSTAMHLCGIKWAKKMGWSETNIYTSGRSNAIKAMFWLFLAILWY